MKSPSKTLGALLGILVFLAGVGLLAYVFSEAVRIFQVPAHLTLGLEPGKPVDFSKAGDAIFALITRVIVLLVMCFVASVIANRGIKMYHASQLEPEPRAAETTEFESDSEV